MRIWKSKEKTPILSFEESYGQLGLNTWKMAFLFFLIWIFLLLQQVLLIFVANLGRKDVAYFDFFFKSKKLVKK